MYPHRDQMSSQSPDGVSFEISADSEEVRLLELPPLLLSKIKSNSTLRLALKAASSNNTTQSQDTSPNAVLCTENETFQIRQVQSSNSLYVIKPFKGGQGVGNSADAAATITAIKQCPNTLELVSITPDVNLFLRNHLPVYNDAAHMIDGKSGAGESSTSDIIGRQALLHHAPLSDGEFERAWTELCCFEISGQAYLPSSHALLSTWRSVLSAATIQGLNLGGDFSFFALRHAINDGYSCLPMFEAIVKRLAVTHAQDSQDAVRLDVHKTVPWIGAILLESQQAEMQVGTFVQSWRDLLPETWRGQASIEDLRAISHQPSRNTIVFHAGGSGGRLATSAPATSRGSNRQWHEKFKVGKR